MRKIATIYLILLGLVLIVNLPAQAQYTWPDYPDIDTASTFTVDTTGSILIDLGSSGPGATWDFTSMDLDGIQYPVEYVDARSTEWSETFPTSDWALSLKQWLSIPATPPIIPADIEDLFSLDSYQRYDATDDAIYDVGIFTDTPLYSGAFSLIEESTYFPFPLELATSWMRHSRFSGPISVELTPGNPISVTLTVSDSSNIVVDATGFVTLPMGTYDCLRLKIERHVSAIVRWLTLPPIPVSQDTFIIYEWHTKDGGMLFQASSHGGETNPDFTDASTVVRLDESNVLTAVDDEIDGLTLPEAFSLDPNFPNPFNPRTSITYRLPEISTVELSIFNILGHQIRVLESSVQSPGEYHSIWNGRDEKGRESPGGMYFYRLKATPLLGGKPIILTRKMLLSK